jgi:hypothetical protein
LLEYAFGELVKEITLHKGAYLNEMRNEVLTYLDTRKMIELY